MAGARELQQRLLTDPQARQEFAANPRAVLENLGVTLPADTELPGSIPLDDLERAVADISEGLREQNVNLADIDFDSTADVTRVIEEAIPLRTRDIRLMEAVHDEFATEALRGGRSPGDNATIAVVGAVVAAVVAVPVAVFGVTDSIAQRVNPQTVIRGVTSRAGGMVIHGPQGVRIEGATVQQVAEVLNRLQSRPGGING